MKYLRFDSHPEEVICGDTLSELLGDDEVEIIEIFFLFSHTFLPFKIETSSDTWK